MDSLQGKTVLITGANSGIGAARAIVRGRRQFLVDGRKLLACYLYKYFPSLFFKFIGKA